MKKYEKILLILFSGMTVIFAADVLYRWKKLDIELDYHMFDSLTTVLAWMFVVSFFGIMTILVSWRLRKRSEAGKKPISKLYKWSFILSFIPFAMLTAASVASMSDGFTFMLSTSYGVDAFVSTLVWYGFILLSVIIPVFPVIVFWQLLYIIKRRKYRKQMKECADN